MLFNRDGDCLAAKLRPGNVHSAEGWEELLLPEIERQQKLGKEVVFRADAAFAKPEIYEALDERGVKYAIRIQANENLERDVAELLPRPVGRPSLKPIMWYKGFLYRAASWKTARRVVARVEHHAGELFPRFGFIVTNLETPSRAVVRFYNKRGTAEQWIKEAKQAVKMTRLSCHRFRSNEVRPWLGVIAYNLGNLWRRLVLPKGIGTWSLTSLQQRLVKTGGRPGKARPLLLAIAGGEPSHAALVRKHAAADGGFAAASRVGSAVRRNQSGRRRGVDGEVSVKWIPNQASHGFLAWAEDLRGRQGLRRWNECEKGGEPGTRGYPLRWLGKQNGNSGLLPWPSIVAMRTAPAC